MLGVGAREKQKQDPNQVGLPPKSVLLPRIISTDWILTKVPQLYQVIKTVFSAGKRLNIHAVS